MMREPMIGQPGMIGRFKDEQIAQQGTWARVPNEARTDMAMHIIHVTPENGSTCTYVNPIDPADEEYVDIPHHTDRVIPASRRYSF